jgi:hypothetical protein
MIRTSRAALTALPLTLALVALLSSPTHAAFNTFEAAGVDAAAITPTRDAFRTAIGGGAVAGPHGSFGGVRREINWDAVGDAFADPNALPANFFNVNSPRGAVFSTPGTGFMVSANAGGATTPSFGFPSDFQVFSAQRLFTAVNSNTTEVTFFVPGTATPATTSAFGAVFTDVEVPALTKVEFFDSNNALIYTRDVLTTGNQGLSFVGAVAGAGEQISRVRLTAALNTISANGILGNPNDDVVVMDDFIYAEPTAVPEPSSLVILLGSVAAFGLGRARR